MKPENPTAATVLPDKYPAKTQSSRFPVVGIGASAGGLEAMGQFFENIPGPCGMAFVVIQHLDPTQPGFLPELLQRITPMEVFQASDQLRVKPNCVYVIPPNKSLSILNDTLHLFELVEPHGLRLPIDIFFNSLADDRQDESIGIILSGMGSDGSIGLKAIKEKNGIVLVQDPATAKFTGMPQSAIDSVIADIVAPANELPAKLIKFLKYFPAVKTELQIDEKIQSNIDKIIILLREKTGHDFSLYKKSTLFRRIERRKGVHQIDKIQNYVRYLQETPLELDILFKELLIGVTEFFRDKKVWQKLEKEILPALFDELPDVYLLRAWIPACSTGEEAYSLAILFIEVLETYKKDKKISLQIFATDIDRDAIEKARKGFFTENIATHVSAERLSRFFTVEGNGYRISSIVREMVVFAPQNVIKDPPFTKLDILSCRNLMIYLDTELQKKLLGLFCYSLNPGGLLILGAAETLGANKDSFTEFDSRLKLFKRNAVAGFFEINSFPNAIFYNKSMSAQKDNTAKVVENAPSVLDNIILQRFAPASVLVNDKGDIIYITGHTGKYLEPVAGKANWNIYAMAREGLRHELPAAFRRAFKNFDAVVLHNLKIGTNGDYFLADVAIQRLEAPESVRGLVIVVFTEVTQKVDQPATSYFGKRNSVARQKELELELQRVHEELQSTHEEMQTSQEELKSTNEELQSTNEELQSTNEELTTSKEEMQSLNEELQTLNIELQTKVNEFVQANSDMKNLLNSTEIATLFLDKELNIRRFTDSITDIFKLRNTDIGRPFTDLVSDLQYPEIACDASTVLKTLVSKETAINSITGYWYTVRIMPYRTLDDRIDGLVITFNDITKYKKMEAELIEAYKLLNTN
jgi:two-component system CheB/CheR fusion protein